MTTAELQSLGYTIVGSTAVRTKDLPRPKSPPRIVRAFVPTPIVSTANRREHWTKRHQRNDAQARAVNTAMGNEIIGRGKPKKVTFVVLSVQPIDSDNLAISCKHCRDSIAKLCGFDDRENVWRYDQRRPLHYEPQRGVFVKVEW